MALQQMGRLMLSGKGCHLAYPGYPQIKLNLVDDFLLVCQL